MMRTRHRDVRNSRNSREGDVTGKEELPAQVTMKAYWVSSGLSKYSSFRLLRAGNLLPW